VRLSGPDAIEVAAGLFEPAGPAARPGGAPAFGRFLGRDGRALDHGFLVLFEPRRSYTGERVAELWAHGSPAVLAELIEAAIARGAQAAGPGEFTYRALRHGRLDLARAEAIRDLIAARTLYQARVAFAQAEGALSERLAPIRESLTEWIARGEAAVEFVDESETHLPPGGLETAIDGARRACRELVAGFRQGRIVREGATLAIVGLPNVGKSSLFNRLLARERAIVTPIAGTTRDTLEEELDLEGIPLRLIDTAGLRDVSDVVESEGVRRAERARREADLVVLVLDGSRAFEPRELEAIERARGTEAARSVLALNKCDLPETSGREVPGAIRVSARTGTGVEELRRALAARLGAGVANEPPLMTNVRHARALEAALVALDAAAAAVAARLSDELILEDLRQAMGHLGVITGELSTEELYDKIFSTFCIGK
jgi:tRNA modification GTPase